MASLTDRGQGLGDRVRRAAARLTDDPGDADEIAVEAPFTGERIGTVPAGDGDDVREAVERARAAQSAWADRPREERAAVLLRFHDLVLEERDELLDLVQREGGKARMDALEEVLDVATNARHYAVRADEYLAPERRKGAFPGLTKTTVHHHPVGVVGVISPWNYPLTLSVSDALPALLAGNAVVCKPAETTPFTALAVADLLYEAGLPEDLFAVVTGYGPDTGPALVEASDYVTFTGSGETGRIVAEQAGRHLTDCSLELGGKNPMLVLESADLDAAVEGALRGSFTNAGQLCISFERIYVQESVHDEFRERFVAAAEALELGAAVGYGYDVGSLASADQLAKVRGHVDDARERGATVHCGGSARPDVGPYVYEPTVLTDLPSDADAAREETFGPVVRVESVPDAETAIERANDSRYGLNAAIYGDRERAAELAPRVECGTVNVNDPYVASWISVDAPMGGMKESGIGRRHGREGIERYTESQTVAVQRTSTAAPDWLPDRVYEAIAARGLKLTRHVPGLR
jgi:succinate-semialdehyde dehydrogenase/glutarate-semialdehyde dehydrogenase